MKKFYLSYFYRLLIEEYLVIVFCVLINFYEIVFQGKQLQLGSSITSVLLAILTILALPLSLTYILKKYKEGYDAKAFKLTHGALSEGLHLKHPLLMQFNLGFLFRRLLTALLIVVARDCPGF